MSHSTPPDDARAEEPEGEPELPPGLLAPLPEPGIWQADLAAIPVFDMSDLTARYSIAIVVPDEATPYKDLVTHTPSEPRDIAAVLATHVIAACAEVSAKPETVEVRFASLAAELRPLLAPHGIRVRHAHPLPLVDLGVAWLATDIMPNYVMGTVLMSRPQLWSAWGMTPEQTGRLFKAAARYYRAAPWEAMGGAPILHGMRTNVGGRPGISWVVRTLGEAEGEDRGILIATIPPIDPQLNLAEILSRARAIDRPLEISLVFVSRDSAPSTMVQESERAGWELAGAEAYPMLIPWHTPAGGVTTEQVEDLIAFLDALPEWAEAHELDLAARRFHPRPLRWIHDRTGVATEFWGWVSTGPA